jgi:hypothetical protein
VTVSRPAWGYKQAKRAESLPQDRKIKTLYPQAQQYLQVPKQHRDIETHLHQFHKAHHVLRDRHRAVRAISAEHEAQGNSS